MSIQMIPLDKLVPSPANVRKTEPLTGIKELAANIRALGLLQNLRDKPDTHAARRRLAAANFHCRRARHPCNAE